MKIKRFHAATMRAALAAVREEQGPDAVILSNRPVEGGVEVIAAIDYDESLFHQGFGRRQAPAREPTPAAAAAVSAAEPPAADKGPAAAAFRDALDRVALVEDEVFSPEPTAGERWDEPIAILREPGLAQTEHADTTLSALNEELKSLRAMMQEELSQISFNDLQRRRPAMAPVIRRLTQLGLDQQLIESLVGILPSRADEKYAWRTVLALLSKRLPMAEDNLLESGGVFALIGPTGTGKTTTLAKLAAQYALRHGADRIGLISTDNSTIGAHEQLFRIGKILGIPVRIATTGEALRRTLDSLATRPLILIDTAGHSHRDPRLVEQLAMLTNAPLPINPLLTLASNTQSEGIREVIQAFSCIDLAGTVVTKIDETSSLGGVLSALITAGLDIWYVTDGQRVPHNLHVGARFRADLVSRAVQLMKQSGDDRPPQASKEEPKLSNYLRQAVSNG